MAILSERSGMVDDIKLPTIDATAIDAVLESNFFKLDDVVKSISFGLVYKEIILD